MKLWFPLLLLLLGCAGARVRPRGVDTTEWREVSSPHFILRTNLPEGSAEQAARELEHLRSALVTAAFGLEIDPPGRLQAVLFRDTDGLGEFVDRRIDGYVTSTSAGPLLVSAGASLRNGGGGEGRTKLLHELAHYLSSFVFLRQPAWFAEGLAEYVETLDFPSGSLVRLGAKHAENIAVLRRQGVLPFEELWAAEDPATAQVAFSFHYYASAWLWYHFFADKYPTRLAAFEEALRRADDPLEAYATSFVNLRSENLEDELQRYLTADRFAVKVERVVQEPVSLRSRVLSAPDLHAMRAELFLESPARRTAEEKQSLAQWEIDQALRSDPQHVEAVLLKSAAQTPEQRLSAARTLVRTRPEDGRAWTFLAVELERDPSARDERLAALERAVGLTPDDAVALNNLAWEKVRRGDPAVGLKLAARAVRIAPWSPSMLDTYAAALFKVGRCSEARANEERAVSLLHEDVSDDTRRELLAALVQYRSRCPASDDGP